VPSSHLTRGGDEKPMEGKGGRAPTISERDRQARCTLHSPFAQPRKKSPAEAELGGCYQNLPMLCAVYVRLCDLKNIRRTGMNHTGHRDAAEKAAMAVDDLEDNAGYNALPMRALTEHLQDPEFWKGLGRARGWQDTGAWLFHWHRFIDHIAFGNEVESFFSSLLV
jgi:hypothetical protein